MAGGRPPYQPQQSVLKPHDEQRQTACIRYISAAQRSHSILSFSEVCAGAAGIFKEVIG
jgi:hypothetical protein